MEKIQSEGQKVKPYFSYQYQSLWCYGVVVITIAQLHSTKLEIRFSVGSNPACSMPEIQDGADF